MDKFEIQTQLNTNKSLKTISEELNTSQTNLRYWIKKFELKRPSDSTEESNKLCLHCKKECSKMYCSTKCKSLFGYYKNKDKRDEQAKIMSKTKRESFKLQALKYGGNCCKSCGYNKNYSALVFHHMDPSEKDFSFGGIKSNTLKEEHKKELDKCILLCHNCHMKVHNSIRELENKVKNKQAIKGALVRRKLIDIKEGKCKVCEISGINDIFAFHHRIESEKEFEIDARTCNGYKYERLLKEADKCDLLCHNCHTETHLPNNLLVLL